MNTKNILMRYVLSSLLTILFTLGGAQGTRAETLEVNSVGKDEATAILNARVAAVRNILHQEVSAEDQKTYQEELRENIILRSHDFTSDVRIVSGGQDGSLYKIKANVIVDREKLRQKFLTISGKPDSAKPAPAAPPSAQLAGQTNTFPPIAGTGQIVLGIVSAMPFMSTVPVQLEGREVHVSKDERSNSKCVISFDVTGDLITRGKFVGSMRLDKGRGHQSHNDNFLGSAIFFLNVFTYHDEFDKENATSEEYIMHFGENSKKYIGTLADKIKGDNGIVIIEHDYRYIIMEYKTNKNRRVDIIITVVPQNPKLG